MGNTLGSVEGLVRNGILKASLSIMYTLLNNIADYVVDQTFKGKEPLSKQIYGQFDCIPPGMMSFH